MLNPRGISASANVVASCFHDARVRPSQRPRTAHKQVSATGAATRPASMNHVLDIAGFTIAPAFTKAPNTKISASAATSGRFDRRPIPKPLAGITAWIPTLSCGQAWTQSRQKVQSKLPVFFGWNRYSSQPRWVWLPRMQSWVRHDPQTLGSRTFTSSGDTSEFTKWNCPMGQTYLQKLAPRKKPSTANAVAK